MPNTDNPHKSGRKLRARAVLGPLCGSGVLFLLDFPACRAALTPSQPLVLVNGNIYTAVNEQPRAQAIVIVEGRIAYVGATLMRCVACRRAPVASTSTV